VALVNHRTARAAIGVLRSSGREAASAAAFARTAWRIDRRRRRQDEAAVAALAERYRRPVLGETYAWDLVERLAGCVDPTDCRLLGVSQLAHSLQILAAMERDGVDDPDLHLAALLHDVGKLALLTGEDPANVVGRTDPIRPGRPGGGLDRVVLQWGHAQIAAERLAAHLPEHLTWLIRYHNTDLRRCAAAMNDRDRAWAERYLRVFAHYDDTSKSVARVPARPAEHYRDLVEKRLPDPILF
jgi:hypothetical protein